MFGLGARVPFGYGCGGSDEGGDISIYSGYAHGRDSHQLDGDSGVSIGIAQCSGSAPTEEVLLRRP